MSIKKFNINIVFIILITVIFSGCKKSELKTEKVIPVLQTETEKSETAIKADKDRKDKEDKNSEQNNASIQAWLQDLQQSW